MPHLSKNKPAEETVLKIKKNLSKVFTKQLKNTFVFEEIFTETEYLMLAKRFAIIVLLFKDVSTYKISRYLKVSNSTILRFQKNISLGKYKNIKKLIDSKTGNVNIFELLEKVLNVGFRPYYGEGRTSWLKDLFDDKK
ncbi:MAG: hypothetical protein QG580_405 [Patescibacteria group bacterium]|jgi:uncharacterized protein YerC|nr:hypothetical protein [Patescibacteria group bacterium]